MKRRRLLLILLLLLLVSGLLLVPSVRWPVYGWLRGEVSYRGMPLSYWSEEIALLESECGSDRWHAFSYGPPGTRPARLLDELASAVGLSSSSATKQSSGWELLGGSWQSRAISPSAVPLLRELLKDPNGFTRFVALLALDRAKATDKDMLAHALNDPDPDVRLMSAILLVESDRDKRAQVVLVLIEGLQHTSLLAKLVSAGELFTIGPAAKLAVPTLIEVEAAFRGSRPRSVEEQVWRSAATALRAIDAEAADKAGVP